MVDELVKRYQALDADCAQLADQLRSARGYELQTFVPTEENVSAAQQRVNVLMLKAQSLIAPDPVFALLRNHLLEFLGGQASTLRARVDRPGVTISGISGFIDFMARKDSRVQAERMSILKERLGQLDFVWDGLLQRLPETSPANVQELIDTCRTLGKVASATIKRLPDCFHGLSSDRLKELSMQLVQVAEKSALWVQQAASSLNTHGGPIQSIAGDMDTIELDEAYYRQLLREELGVDLDELLRWHDEEVEKTRAEVFVVASRLGRKPSSMDGIVQLLNSYAGPCASVEEMFRRGREYLARARQGALEYVRLPAESCVVNEVPEQVRAHFPWGGYGGGCPRRRPLLGEMFLNESNYQAVTDGWLKMMAIHEGYPGHHVQFVRATMDPLPETIKLGARSVPLIEGTAHRSERVFEFVFAEDPYYPLFVAYRRHHTAVRIKAELGLRYVGRPIGEAVQLYMDELGFDRATARGQVKAQELMVGYFNCYYYGMKRLQDLERQYGYDEKQFTELLFAAGRVSLDSFEAFLGLSDADRQRYLTGFPSLLQGR